MTASANGASNRHDRVAYTSDAGSVTLARRQVARFAAACGFSEDDVSDIRLATGEALSNAVEHGGHSLGQIVVDCTFAGDELTIEVEDSGSGFPEPPNRAKLEPDDRGRGFGIYLMRRLMDEVSFASNGRIVRLVRRLA